MSLPPYSRRPGSQGRGQAVQQNLQFWEDRPGRPKGASIVKRDPVSNNFKLHVRSIPTTWNLTLLKSIFSKCGTPKNVYYHDSKGPLTWGFVEFETYPEAELAVRELHHNFVLGIEVMFARDKPNNEEDVDPIPQVFATEEEMMNNEVPSPEPLVDPRALIRTVKNDGSLSSGFTIYYCQKPVFDQNGLRNIEEGLIQTILDRCKQDEDSTNKCKLCNASCFLACSNCVAVFYCSENCQSRDWASHSRSCKGARAGAAEDSMHHPRGDGDFRQLKSETNGYGSHDLERGNRSDNRNNRFGAERRNDRGNNRGSGGFNRDRSHLGEQVDNHQQGRRPIGEQRRAMMTSSQNGSDKGFQNRFDQHNQRPRGGQEPRNTFKPRLSSNADAVEDWGSQTKDNDAKNSTAATPGLDFINKEKAFLKAMEPTTKDVSRVSVTDLQAIKCKNKESSVSSTADKVLIVHPENRGLFWVQNTEQQKEINTLTRKLDEYFKTCTSQFIPIQDGICGIKYEDRWYRCQITGLNPLVVRYIDLGYPETVEADRLFTLPPELISLPPHAFLIKLLDGTHESFLTKGEGDYLTVKLTEKAETYWLAQVVDDKKTTPESLEIVTQAVTKIVELSVEPPQTQPDVAVNKAATGTPTQLESQQKTEVPGQSSVQQPFPPMFDATKFTTVVVAYPGDKDQKDTYFVGAATLWNTLVEMCSYFSGVIDRCEVLTPKHGAVGLALYLGEWYRVKVVSLTPLRAYYIDFGNIETLEPEGLKRCPDTHKDIPPLVQKIKLAPGTNEKYFSLPEESQINVKPVSWLADCSILVEVEGENYKEIPTPIQGKEIPTPIQGSEDCSSPAGTTTPTLATNPNLPPSPTQSSTSGLADSVNQTSLSSPLPVQVNLIPSEPHTAVDMLQEKWKILFVPNKVDLVKNSLLGQVCCENIPATFSFTSDNETFQNYLSSQVFDPHFRPNVGEVVGLRNPSGEWERAQVLRQEDLLSLNDICGVVRSSQLFKLPETFVNIPSMATVFTLLKQDPAILNRLVDEVGISFEVVEVTNTKKHATVKVTGNILGEIIEGELEPWMYEPLEVPDPLTPGDSVTIVKVIDSNTLLVSPANDLAIQQDIQIGCLKSSDEFVTPPKEGDYVAFLDKESDGYFRCRIDKVDGDTYTVYSVDNATYHQPKLCDLRPLPKSLRNIPCRITQIELKDVDKVIQTEQAQVYLRHIVEEDKSLTIDTDSSGKSVLTIEGEKESLNSKLKELLKPQVVPDSEGKLTIQSLPLLRIPLNQELEFIVTQREPLYAQEVSQLRQYYHSLHGDLQTHAINDKAPYNPCTGELCIGLYEGEWYRCRCLQETNTGVSVLMLVDYGNIFNAQTSGIRRISPEMLTLPGSATSLQICGFAESITPAKKAELENNLVVDAKIKGTLVAENDDCYDIVIESVEKP